MLPISYCRHLASEQSSVKPSLACLGACFCRRISFNYLAYTVHETAPCLVPVGRICGNDHKPIHYSSSQPCAAKRAARSLLLCQLPCSRVRARLPPMATTTNNYNNMVPRPFFGNRVQERRGFYVHKKIYLVKTPLSNHEHGKKGWGGVYCCCCLLLLLPPVDHQLT